VIRMLMAHQKASRFINKNPLNGFRVGFLRKMFPDAKFVLISRDPVSTCKSQLSLHESICRALYIDNEVEQFRKLDMKPTVKAEDVATPGTWPYLMHGHNPNEAIGQPWFPRLFPRTTPEHQEIMTEYKQGKVCSAFAKGVRQQEKYVLEQLEKNEGEFVEGDNLMTIFHEDLLQNASLTFEKVLQFCQLECTAQQRLQWLEMEDFPNGQARAKRIKPMSTERKQDEILGEEEAQVRKILEPCLRRYENRGALEERVEKWNEAFARRQQK